MTVQARDQTAASATQQQVDASKARRSLRNGFITLVLGGALAVGLLLAVPGLKGVATTVSHMKAQWVVVAVVLEVLSCASYVLAFLQVFDRAPLRVGARVALSEEAFGAAVSLGGVGSLAVGGWLMVERGASPRADRRALGGAVSVHERDQRDHADPGRPGPVPRPPGPEQPAAQHRAGGGRRSRAGAVSAVAALRRPHRPAAATRAAARVSDRDGGQRTRHRATGVPSRLADRRRDRLPVVRHRGAVRVLRRRRPVPPLAPVVLAYQIAYLSNFIPVPGGIGVLDGSMIGMLVLYGVGGTVATAATLVYHAISLWVPAVWGTIAFIVLQKTKKQPVVLRNPTEELHPRSH